ncbi:MAG: hypothetical protein KKF50_00490 [Nanoarchaeota archaeon]|nr:hypothetical protein [Nanoarchaeota archaeon]
MAWCIFFAWCGLPQFIKAITTKKVEGLSLTFLFMWLFGEFFSLIYVMWVAPRGPLIFNYVLNLFLVFGILFVFAIYGLARELKPEVSDGIISG